VSLVEMYCRKMKILEQYLIGFVKISMVKSLALIER